MTQDSLLLHCPPTVITRQEMSGEGIRDPSPNADIRALKAYATQPKLKATGVSEKYFWSLSMLLSFPYGSRTPETSCAQAFWTMSPPIMSNTAMTPAGLTK